MFIENKYTFWYNNIIEHYRKNPPVGYTEEHHILPRSMKGSDDSSNLVKLPAKAHFICHVLLVKMTTGRDLIKMKYALTLMLGKNGITRTSRLYSSARLGWSQTADHIQKRVDSKKGYRHSDATKQKISVAVMNRDVIYKTCDCGITIDIGNYTKYHGPNCGKQNLWSISDETKKKISLANKNRTLPKYKCPHCDIQSDMGNFKRWHGDKCKKKDTNENSKNITKE